MVYQSTKIIDGFSTCFRQWRAIHSHCSYLHGYSISFELTFESDSLDDKNWVEDFGFTKQLNRFNYSHRDFNSIKEWFDYMFDHTVIIAEDDPHLSDYEKLQSIDLRIVKSVGAEKFAELVYDFITEHYLSKKDTFRVRLKSVKCMENSKNSAIISK